MRVAAYLGVLVVAACHASTGDAGGADAVRAADARAPGEAPDAGPTSAAIPFDCKSNANATIVPGVNEIAVGDATRRFLADLPRDLTRPLGVVFSWYGFGDNAQQFHDQVQLDPDLDPAHPRIVITPQGSGQLPPVGLDWDISQGTPADTNVDLPFFEEMLGCLAAQYTLDPSAIHSFGFSAGAVMTNLLHARYPDVIRAVVSESGAWFDDPAQVALVTIPAFTWSWPALDPADGGVVLLTHGGPNDRTVLDILDLEAAAQAAIPFLLAHGRTVIDCAHDGGHALAPQVTPEVIAAFLAAGDPAALPAVLPAGCTLRQPAPP